MSTKLSKSADRLKNIILSRAATFSNMSQVLTDKKALRKEMKAVLTRLSPMEKARQSKVVFDKLVSEPHYQNANSISIYLHMQDEVQTLDILKHALGYFLFNYDPPHQFKSSEY